MKKRREPPSEAGTSATTGKRKKQKVASTAAAGVLVSKALEINRRSRRLSGGETSSPCSPPAGSGSPSKYSRRRTTVSKVRDFALVHDDDEARMAGFIYRKMWVADIPILRSLEGRLLLRKLKLTEFLLQPIPILDKELCDEFIASFDSTTRSAFVRGQRVTLDPPMVSTAVKIPLGRTDLVDAAVPTVITKEMHSSLKRMLMNVKEKKIRGYDLGQFVYGDKVDLVSCIASALMTRLEVVRECFHYATPEILLALDMAIRDDVEVQWAGHLANLITRSIRKSRKGATFAFGEWLTVIIRHQLEGNGNVDGTVAVITGDAGDEVVRLRSRLEESEVEMNRLQGENVRMSETLEELISGNRQQADAGYEVVHELRDENWRLKDDLGQLRRVFNEKVEFLEAEKERLLKESEQEMERLKAEIAEELNRQQDEVGSEVLDAENRRLKDDLGQLGEKVESLESEKEHLLKESEDRLKESEHEMERLKAEKSELEEKVASLKSCNQQLLRASQHQLDRVVTMVSTEGQRVTAIVDDMASVMVVNEQRVTEFTQKIDRLRQLMGGEIERLKELVVARNNHVNAEIRSLKNSNKGYEVEVSELKKTVKKLEEERRFLKAENERKGSEVEHELGRSRAANKQLEQQIGSFTAWINQLEQELAKSKLENKRLEAELARSKSENEQLEKGLASNMSENEQLAQGLARFIAENKKLLHEVKAGNEEKLKNKEHELSIFKMFEEEKERLLRGHEEMEAEIEGLRAENEKMAANLKERELGNGLLAQNLSRLHLENTKLKVDIAEKEKVWERERSKELPDLKLEKGLLQQEAARLKKELCEEAAKHQKAREEHEKLKGLYGDVCGKFEKMKVKLVEKFRREMVLKEALQSAQSFCR